MTIGAVLAYKSPVTTRSFARPGLRWLFLLAFAAVALGINFFHNETGLFGRDDCPACHFITSSMATGPGVVFALPSLLCRGTLAPAESFLLSETIVFALSSRSPPQA